MSLSSSDLVFYRAALNSDDTAALNGGRVSGVAFVTNTKGLFPDVYSAARASGVTHHRKLFPRNTASDLTPLLNLKLHVGSSSNGDDYTMIRASTTETLNQVSGTTRHYAAGTLAAAISTGATTAVVTLEHPAQAALTPFRAGDEVRIGQTATGYDPDFLTVSGVSHADGNVASTFSTGETVVRDGLRRLLPALRRLYRIEGLGPDGGAARTAPFPPRVSFPPPRAPRIKPGRSPSPTRRREPFVSTATPWDRMSRPGGSEAISPRSTTISRRRISPSRRRRGPAYGRRAIS